MSLATTSDPIKIKGKLILGFLINNISIAFIEFDTSENAQRAKDCMDQKQIEARPV